MPALTAQQFISKDYAAALNHDQLLAMYEAMLLARKLDERMWILHRQGKVAFHISGMGHEACQVGAAFTLERGKDWLHPYYRDMAFVLAMGMTPRHLMLALFGRAEDPSSGGRQMPAHYGYLPSRIVTGSSPVATQVPQAAGIALASKLRGLDEVTVACLGEGATAQGDFHEALNWAGIHRLPLITLVQNNQYAISQGIDKEMPVRNVADRGEAYGMPGVMYDGNDVLESYNVTMEAVLRARSGQGPTPAGSQDLSPRAPLLRRRRPLVSQPRRSGDVEEARPHPPLRASPARGRCADRHARPTAPGTDHGQGRRCRTVCAGGAFTTP